MLRGTAVAAIAGVLAGTYFIVTYGKLQREVKYLEHLKVVNQQQGEQIQELRQQTTEMQQRMQAVVELDKQVRELVGLNPKPPSGTTLSSRGEGPMGGGAVRALSVGPLDEREDDVPPEEPRDFYATEDLFTSDGLFLLQAIGRDLQGVGAQIEEQLAGLEQLQKEVAARQRYLAAIPSRWPLSGRITSRYGYRRSPFGREQEFHDGLDIAARRGSPVVAAGAGKVTFTGWKSGYGLSVIIDHGYGYRTLYGHNSSVVVKVGQTVKKGDVVSRVGSTGRSTGPHLHFTVFYNGNTINPEKVFQ